MNGTVPHAWLRRVSDYCSSDVSATERATVEAHLATCAQCRQALASYRRFDALVRSPLRLGDGAVGVLPGYRPAIEEEIMITNDSDRETGTTTIRPRRPRATLTTLGAIAAVVLVAILAGVLFAHLAPSHLAGPRPTSTPATAPSTRPTVLFQNSLAANPDVTTWIDDPSSGCFFAGGGYHVKGRSCEVGFDLATLSSKTDSVTNADITVSVKQVDGPATGGYGIVLAGTSAAAQGGADQFHIQSAGTWTFLECRGAGFNVAAACTTIIGPTATAAIHTGLGVTNTLEVRVLNNHFDFFVNGTKVGEADDSQYATFSGHIDLDASNGIEVVFNDLKIATAS